MKERIVIVTLYDSINCGTFLQAYSLGEYLKEKGFDPVYLKLKNDNSNINKNGKSYKKLKISEIIVKAIRKILLKLKFSNINSYFSTVNLEEVNEDKNIKYVIVGSDEIWNVNNNSFIHYNEYFGYNFENKKIIAYAPSCNDITKNDILKFNPNINFKNFSYLSARDKKTYDLLNEFGEKNVQMVLDPTFLTEKYQNKLKEIKLKDYIIVYGHNFTDEQVEIIKKISKNKNKKIVSITRYYSWCDKNIIADPFEFLSYIKNADYIITSTFHGSVFSILFEKNFIAFVEKVNKVYDLLNKFKLNNRIFDNFEKGIELLNEAIDYAKIIPIKANYTNESKKYLLKVLDMENPNEQC